MFQRPLIRRGILLLLPVIGTSLSASQVQSPPSSTSREPPAADDRLEISAIHHTLRVAEPNEIPIVLHAPGLQTIITEQKIDGDDPYGMAGGQQTPQVLRHADGSTYVNIVPIRLGKLTIRFMATFSDGGYTSQNLTVDVEPSKVAPAALGLVDGSGLYLDLNHPHLAYLSPMASYYGMQWAVPIPARFATFKVKSADQTPVIEINPVTGELIPLHKGDAMVETNYLGLTMQNCVQVRDAPISDYLSNCRELRHLDQLAASTPLNHTWTADPGGFNAFFGNAANIYFFTDRLAVLAPDHSVGLGQSVRIPICLSADNVRSVVFQQWIYDGLGFGVPAVVRDANGLFLGGNNLVPAGQKRADPLRDGGDSGKFIEVVPLGLGNLEVGVAVYFEDGGFDQRFFRMKVVPSSRGLAKFQGYETQLLQLSSDQQGNHSTQLTAAVTYDGLQDAITIYSLEGVKFSVQQQKGPAVVEVDDKGGVKALHPGDAVVVADFDGVKWSYPIHVVDAQHAATSSH